MENKDAVCKDKSMALLILETFKENMKNGTQKDALEAVVKWLRETVIDDRILKMTREERETRIMELITGNPRVAKLFQKARENMTREERKEMAAYYLEGVKSVRSKTDK